MSGKTFLISLCWFVGLVLAQAIVFNHICLLGYAVPFVFIYFLVKLPMSIGVNWMLTLGFLLGVSVDVFSDTYGMNALACTLLAFWRRPIFRAYAPNDDDIDRVVPTLRTMGTAAFYKYLLTMTLAYCFLIFVIEAFGFFQPLRLLICIVASTALSFLILAALDRLVTRKI